MSTVYRLLASLVPGRSGDWLLAHGAELDALDEPAERRRWIAGLPRVFVTAMVGQLVKDPLSLRGGALMRTVVATLSAIEVAGGGALLTLAVLTETLGPGVFAAVLIVQGGFTLLLLAGAFRRFAEPARHLQLAGSAAAVFVGLAGFAYGFLSNLAATDPEYAPMTLLLLVAMHGLASIAAFTAGPPPVAATHGS
jgi:hypothetical protein